MTSSSVNSRGIVAMIVSSAAFSANDAATKLAAETLPPTEIMAIRGAFTILLVLAIVAWRGEFRELGRALQPLVLLRCGSEATVGLLLIVALALMPIADATAILLVQPFLVTIAGVLFFKEIVGWRRWSAVAAGFVGMLFVVKPGTSAFDVTSLLVLFAALLVAVRDITTRMISVEVPTTAIVLVTAVLGILIGLAGAFGGNWRIPDPTGFAAAVVAAGFFVIGIILGVIAFRATDVSVVAPFRYSLVIFAVIYGVLLFREFPDLGSLVGIGMIVAAGIYMLHREAVRRGQMRAAAAPTIAGQAPRP